MEAASREAFSPEVKTKLFEALDLVESDWQDLGGFESFVFAHPDRKEILRLTHESHRSGADIQAELEFLQHLKQGGGAVCEPLRFSNGLFWRELNGFTASSFQMAEGRLIQQTDWGAELWQSWGAAIGRFHRLSGNYLPQGPRRFSWQDDANLDFRSRTPSEQEQLLQIGDRYLEQLRELPASNDKFGLIHSDAHAGNFFTNDGQLQFFDFDDCCYQWFAFDIATIVFSAVLQPWMSDEQQDREAVAMAFLPEFLKGYAAEFDVSDFLLEVLPLFLKLREFSLYAVIHSHMDVNNLTDWYPIKFMAGRQERLERDLPYLELNVKGFAP